MLRYLFLVVLFSLTFAQNSTLISQALPESEFNATNRPCSISETSAYFNIEFILTKIQEYEDSENGTKPFYVDNDFSWNITECTEITNQTTFVYRVSNMSRFLEITYNHPQLASWKAWALSNVTFCQQLGVKYFCELYG